MNKARRKELDRADALLSEALEIIQACADEEREAFDNLSESLKEGERGQAMGEAADALDEAACSVEEAVSRIQDAC